MTASAPPSTDKTKLITIQRSKGYATRPSFSVEKIGQLIAFCKQCKPDALCMVDNCYGEFVERGEPSDVGADMIVGSLIKNPGGGLAPIGGYICGTAACVERCAYRLSRAGAGSGGRRESRHCFRPCIRASSSRPRWSPARSRARYSPRMCTKSWAFRASRMQQSRVTTSFRQSTLGSAERMLAFCRGIQAAAPVDSYVTPVPWAMPGYDSEVVMAAGAFVQGSSIELSADGPIRPPYAVYFQGGLTWYHAKLGILMSLQKLVEADLASLPN